ncbi:MAG: small multi-drug export protein [Planctomycetota bacterium]|jgi:uncharacterized membrane protein|nr:small multi-drug export protein [Planctomycetota bacterium]MDG2143270.1 small multi-drug export protein [Planctomycetota bacterium]
MARYESPLERLLYRLAALGVIGATGLLLWTIFKDSILWNETLESAGASVAALGKYIVFRGLSAGSSLGPYGMVLLVLLIDLNICIALTSGVKHLERAPALGRWIRVARRRTKLVLDANPGLQGMAFFGVTLFVFLPLPATGGVMGTFAARLIGLSRLEGLCAVGLGAGGIGLVFAVLGQGLKDSFEQLGPLGLAVAAVLVGILGWLVILRVRRILKSEG